MSLMRISVMRFWIGSVPGVFLLASLTLGQNSDSTSAHKQSPIELKPDASGVVPAEQIRELLRRVEEKDLENERGSATTPISSARSGTTSTVMAQ